MLENWCCISSHSKYHFVFTYIPLKPRSTRRNKSSLNWSCGSVLVLCTLPGALLFSEQIRCLHISFCTDEVCSKSMPKLQNVQIFCWISHVLPAYCIVRNTWQGNSIWKSTLFQYYKVLYRKILNQINKQDLKGPMKDERLYTVSNESWNMREAFWLSLNFTWIWIDITRCEGCWFQFSFFR